jgi:Tol biopolymer transport system component
MLVALCAAAGVLGITGAPAQAASIRSVIGSFGPGGPGSGDFSEVTGVAVEQSSHDVYVYDAGEGGRVYKFNAAGEPQKFSSLPANVIEGVGGYGSGESEIAVDSSSGLDKGDIYIATLEEVAIYAPTGARLGTLTTEGGPIGVAVDPSGDVYVAFYEDEAVKKYTPATNPVTEADYTSSLSGVGAVSNIAVDSAGDIYATEFGSDVTRYAASEFNALGMPAFGTVIDPEGATLAVDPSSGDVYIDEGLDIAEYSPSGSRVESFGTLSESHGVAESHESGDVYASAAKEKGEVVIYGPLVVYPTVAVGSISEPHDTSVTLNGTVNPEATQVTACEFEYGTTTSYGQSKPCSKAVPFTGNSPEAVSANLTELQSGTTYYFRVSATNSNGTEEAAGTFETPGPTIAEESVASVSSTSAELQAQIDPRGVDTSYYFQYGPTTSYGTSVPVPPGVDIGAGTTDESVAQQAQGLEPGTYHYRVVAVQGTEVLPGLDHTFTTLPQAPAPGIEFALPDGREWEMVSPPRKNGAEPDAITREGGEIQASEDGEAISYVANGPMPAETKVEGHRNPESSQILSTRGSQGWASQDIATPTTTAQGAPPLSPPEYSLFSSNLALALVRPYFERATATATALAEPPLSPPLSPAEAGHQEKTISLRADVPLAPEVSEAASYAAAQRNGEAMHNPGFLALLNAQNAPGGGASYADAYEEVVSATPDLSHVVSSDDAVVPPDVAGSLKGELYEWGPGGAVQPVSVLPGQTSVGEGSLGSLGDFSGKNVRHAISNDGTLVFWTGHEGDNNPHLYVRDTETKGTLQLDTVQAGASGAGEADPEFQTASTDGSRVFFTDTQRLTADSRAESEKPDLYVFELASAAGEPLAGKVTDLTPRGENGESADVLSGVPGASDDGSYVYFVARGALASDATDGECSYTAGTACNLYVRHYDGTQWSPPQLVAALSYEDARDWGFEVQENNPWSTTGAGALFEMTSRVSPDGQYLAFMSDRSLTGYDNTDANSGMADEEVFLYDASDGRLVCASCNPSGAQPVGIVGTTAGTGFKVDEIGNWQGRWLAGSVPGWTRDSLYTALYQSRYLSNSGRLFFNSPDDLVPAATSAQEKVYEYEPGGVGGCSDSAGEAGCVGLISPGDSEHEAAFLDASASGGDVFFLTADKLVTQDTDSAYDVYDAHECTGVSPCPPAAGTVPPACTTAESCRAASAPQPEIFGAPPSQTFSGAGNIAPVTAAVSPKAVKKRTAAQVKAEKLVRALKACRKKAKKKRAGCEKQARKKYGAKAKKKAKAKKTNRRSK